MALFIDARIPVRLGTLASLADADALLIEGDLPDRAGPSETFAPMMSPHAPACACCAGRSPAAIALDRLFQRRARGEIAFFRRVLAIVATEAGTSELCRALGDDAIASARFRLEHDRTRLTQPDPVDVLAIDKS